MVQPSSGGLLECLEGKSGVVSLLAGWQLFERGEARMVEAQVVAALGVSPTLFDLIHGPHLVNVLRKLVPYLLDVARQLDL